LHAHSIFFKDGKNTIIIVALFIKRAKSKNLNGLLNSLPKKYRRFN
jgi:hypothetical protein